MAVCSQRRQRRLPLVGAGEGAGVWVNTECIEIHHGPRSANSCNLQSTLTLCKKPASLQTCAASAELFVVTAQSGFLCVCVCIMIGACKVKK